MLEKNKNIFYFDAHFHLADCLQAAGPFDKLRDHMPSNWTACSCSHSIEEWEIVQALREPQGPHTGAQGPQIIHSYGLHPQSAGHINIQENADFLEQLLQQKKLHAIGEAGFDYFTRDYKDHAAIQEEMFNIQLDLALKYNLPLVIHCRKANEKLFEYSKQLKKLPAVLFHSFMGTPIEAKSLLKRGINGFFSFGKQVMNNNKKVIACVRDLPADVLLTETDAPWQFLKGESHTNPLEIKKIFEAFCRIRNEAPEILARQIKQNFLTLFFQNSNTKS
jgi:TatD DNase family protein